MSFETPRSVPPRVQVALEFVAHTRWITHQHDASIPPRQLTTLERSVESAALRTLQAYFLGEMDFGDAPPITHPVTPPARQGPSDDDPPAVYEWIPAPA